MRGSHGSSRKSRPLRSPPRFGQVSENPDDRGSGSAGPVWNKDAWDVLDRKAPRSHVPNQTPEVGPEVALVGLQEPFAGEGVALTGNASNHRIHSPPQIIHGSSGDAPQIREHRCRSQGLLLHARRQDGEAVGFPLNVQNWASVSAKDLLNGELESHVEPADAGADGDEREVVIHAAPLCFSATRAATRAATRYTHRASRSGQSDRRQMK